MSFNPAEIADQLRTVSDRLESGAKVVSDNYAASLEAKRTYALALAEHRQDAMGSWNDRSDQAMVACRALWVEQDNADVAYRHAVRLAEALEKKLSSLQTEAKLIMQAWSAA